ncbi:Rossmann-like and DUF2520 domain-containing protein [Sphingobacterium paucimobilis]|uniref:DUF2520 domain-containing protein n=1 Tax=Sphingobacterium paucimobilis HER1398 TaxID=1346330 RepID=U2HYK7_9SPHI|nr:Rossmann-like and DUF2520 domain-containing protein [Sphingobacterium paucimobilis]ERJ60622.1 hypothetical protein M472_17845 [Sphingobacterium paucimobilis HER1398]
MNIVILGSGNVATLFAQAFYQNGHQIAQVYSRQSANAKALADAVKAQATADLNQLNLEADIYLIAVADSAIPQVVADMPSITHGIVVHSSGATPLEVLNRFPKKGVIYPAQSISKQVNIDMIHVPIGIEADDAATYQTIHNLISPIAPHLFSCNTEQRLALHLAAVLVNNFPNALFNIAQQVLERQNLDFDLLRPIILETANKVQNHLPSEVQTGPAVRNDLGTINRHLHFLSYSNELTQIYQHLSDFIIKSRQK